MCDPNKIKKMHSFFVSNDLDLFLLQEIRKVSSEVAQKYINLRFKMNTNERRNGVAIFINTKRYNIRSNYEDDQFQLLELSDFSAGTILFVVNVYLKPTNDMREKNELVIKRIDDTMKFALIQGRNVLFGVILISTPIESNEFQIYGYSCSKTGPTRI